MWYCYKCGETNDDNSTQCKRCGSKRSSQSTEPRPKPNPTPKPVSESVSEPTPEPPSDGIKPVLADTKSKEETVTKLRLSILAATLLQFVLFAAKYTRTDQYTIYKACSGLYGSIEQICSILLVILTIIPAITVLMKLDVRKRNLPITTSAIIASLATVYCFVIWFGNPDPTVVPALIILLSWGVVFLAYRYVKALNAVDNTLLYRPTSF